MEDAPTGARPTEPELDEALSRAVRQLIAAAAGAGEAEPAPAAA